MEPRAAKVARVTATAARRLPRSSSAGPRRSSGSRRARRGGIRWDRVARLSLLLVLLAVLASYLGPAADYLKTWKLAKQTRAEVQDLRRDNDALRTRARRLQDPRTIELEARRIGMARPGERVYVIKGLPGP
jgi:cell division protein FtsB